MKIWQEIRAEMMRHPWLMIILFSVSILFGLYLHMFIPWAG